MPERYLGTSLADRRRARRRRLQQPTTIRIRTSADSDFPQFEARMLNLSEQGLACRMNTTHASQLNLGQIVSIEFTLPSVRARVGTDARIANLTPGGSADRCVIGMEFVHQADDDDVQRKVRAELELMGERTEDSSPR